MHKEKMRVYEQKLKEKEAELKRLDDAKRERDLLKKKEEED